MRTVAILTATLVIGITSVAFYIRSHEQEIIQYVLSEIDKSLKGEVKVNGVDVSIFRNFPRISLILDGIDAKGSCESETRSLLTAEKIELNFNLWNILSKRYEIRSIEVHGAYVYVRTYADSSVNYAIWEGSSDGNALTFSLKKILLDRVTYHHCNSLNGSEYVLYTTRSSAAGLFSAKEQSFRIKSKLRIQRLAIQHQVIIDSIDLSIKTVMQHQIDANKQSSMLIQMGDIRIQGMRFSTQGSIFLGDEHKRIDLALFGKDIVLEDMINYMPESIREYLEVYRFKGALDFEANIKGAISGVQYPLMEISCRLQKGEVYHKDSHQTLSDLAFEAKFKTLSTQGSLRYQASLSQLQGRWKSGAFKGNLSIDPNSYVTAQGNIDADIEELHQFFKLPAVRNASGRIKAQAQIQTLWEPEQGIDFYKLANEHCQIQLIGKSVQLDLVNFEQQIAMDSIRVKYANGNILESYIRGRLDQTSFETHVKAHRLIPYLQGSASLFLDADVVIPQFIIPQSTGHTGSDSAGGLLTLIPPRIHGHVRIKSNKVIYDSIVFSALDADVYLQDQIFDIERFEANAFDGRIRGRLEGRLTDQTVALSLSGQLQGVALDQVFKGFSDFGQESLTHKHIRGRVNMDYHLSSVWILGKGIDPKSIVLSTHSSIENGELIKLPTLQKLSRFIDESTLEHIRFTSLENSIDIKNSLVLIPEMTIGSNAMNLSLVGAHYFDGRIDYTIRIALSELMSKRRRERRRQKDLEAGNAIVDDGKRTAIYVHIGGTVDSPIFTYRLKAGTLELNESLRKDKATLKEALNTEFSGHHERRAAIEKEKAQWQEQEKGQFIIDMDERSDSIAGKTSIKPPKKAPLKKDTARIRIVFDED